MSEKFPQVPPTKKIESKESKERPPRYRTIEDNVVETHADGSKTHHVLECNGHSHRRAIDRIFYDEDGNIIFDEEELREDAGPCDGNHA
jgi:ABC-type nickel/cobalt efflux system permease component RcnA